MTDDQLEENIEVEEATAYPEEAPQYGVGPFSIREVALAGVWLVAFVVSFFSISTVRFDSVWTSGLLWILTIGVPTVAVFLIVLRRLSPDGIRRVGSLGVDQFASVAFAVASVVWLQLIWETVAVVAQDGPWLRSWVIWVEIVLMLAGVLLTTFAPLIAPFDQDFRGRREVPAHRNARPIRAITPRPAPAPRPIVPDEPEEQSAFDPAAGPAPYADDATMTAAPSSSQVDPVATGAADWEPTQTRDTFEPIEQPAPDADIAAETAVLSTETAAEPQVRHQAFWALAPEDRDVVDEIGIPVFRIGPGAWALVIEDRGDVFVVRHEDGRIGYLHDVTGITRG